MRIACRVLLTLLIVLGVARGASAQAPTPNLAALEGRWTLDAAHNCQRNFYVWSVRYGFFRFEDEHGQVDVERITQASSDSFVTETVASKHELGGATPIGTRWLYRVWSPSEVRVQNLGNNHEFTLFRCY